MTKIEITNSVPTSHLQVSPFEWLRYQGYAE